MITKSIKGGDIIKCNIRRASEEQVRQVRGSGRDVRQVRGVKERYIADLGLQGCGRRAGGGSKGADKATFQSDYHFKYGSLNI